MPKKNEEPSQKAREDSIRLVFKEIRRAESIHPGWPDNPFEGLAYVTEELGEAAQAAVEAVHRGAPWKLYHKELTHLAAMSLRILFNYKGEKIG